MKAITLYQPWATAIFTPFPYTADIQPGQYAGTMKQWETRSWATKYRGTLLIHAAASRPTWVKDLEKGELFAGFQKSWGEHTYGAILGHVYVKRIIPTSQWVHDYYFDQDPEKRKEFVEQSLGDYTSGRWAWELDEPVKFNVPMPYKGGQRIWNVDNMAVYDHVERYGATRLKQSAFDGSKFPNKIDEIGMYANPANLKMDFLHVDKDK